MKLPLIVFDIDGTLTNTKDIDDQCYLETMLECWGCRLEEADWSSFPLWCPYYAMSISPIMAL